MLRNLLITGGAGFIGSTLVEKLLGLGLNVVVVDNFSDYYDTRIKRRNIRNAKKLKGYQVYNLDILDNKKLEQVFKKHKFSCLIHLASEVGVRLSFKRSQDYIDTNIQGTLNLLNLAHEFKVPQVIFGSSSSVYGKRSGSTGFKETDALSPISPYAATKRAAELLWKVYAQSFGLKVTCLRFFTVYGPRNRPDMACYKFTDSIYHRRPIELYGHRVKRDFTYVDDIVDGIIKAINKPVNFEIINLGNSSPILVSSLIKSLEKLLGKKAIIRKRPLPLGDVPITFANVSKAKKLLKWEPKTKIDHGLTNLVDWYKQNLKL